MTVQAAAGRLCNGRSCPAGVPSPGRAGEADLSDLDRRSLGWRAKAAGGKAVR